MTVHLIKIIFYQGEILNSLKSLFEIRLRLILKVFIKLIFNFETIHFGFTFLSKP